MTEQQEYWQQFDETFFKDGYNICSYYLNLEFTKSNMFAAQKKLYAQIDLLNESFLKRTASEGNKADCKMGCSICCNQTVLATPYEFFYLADFVSKKFQSEQLKVIIERAEIKRNLASKLPIDKLLKFKHPCPLLHPTQGFCRAYQARPMACRIYLSSSVKSCDDDFNAPGDDRIFPKLFDMPLRAGRMMNEGFQARLREGKETTLQAFENTIEEGLLVALDSKTFDKWLNGQSVFHKLEKK